MRSRNHINWILAAALVLLTVAVYVPVLSGGFIWDDTVLVARNPLVTHELSIRSVWFHTDFPLTVVALWLQWLVAGIKPALYHGVNISFHIMAALLLWAVLEHISKRYAEAKGAPTGADSGPPWLISRKLAPWAAAMLFALHPVASASAGWISEQKNTLSLVFYLAGLWFFLLFLAAERDGRKRRSQYAASLICFVGALLSKTSTVMLPVSLLVIGWLLISVPFRKLALSASPFFLLSAIFGWMTIWFQNHQTMTTGAVSNLSWIERLLCASKAIWFYALKDSVPLKLSMIYPQWHLSAASPVNYIAPLTIALVIAVLWLSKGKPVARACLVLALLFIVNLFPALGFFQMYYFALSRVSDHLQYIPLCAFAAGLGFVLINRRWLRLGTIAFAAVLIGFAALTWKRATILARDETVWEDTLKNNPASWTAHNNLGCIRAEQGRMTEAVDHFRASIAVDPKNAAAHSNLARALAAQNDTPAAETEFQLANDLKPGDPEISRNYAQLLLQEKKPAEARRVLETVPINKRDLEASLALGRLCQMQRDPRKAEDAYRDALKRDPDSLEALNNLAWLLSTSTNPALRDGAEATRCAEKACELTKCGQPMFVGTLAAAYAEAGRFSDAVATAQKASTLADGAGNPQFAEMNRRLMRLYESGRPFRQ
jgi:Tfp pilus assembly protein PilF